MTTTGAHGAVRFPVVSAQGVELETVQCILSPRERAKKAFVIHGPDPIEVERILGEARSAEQHENSAFSVNVRFVPNCFSDNSYSLALAIADKWARGCWPELSERSVILATGLLETGGAGVVGAIGHFAEKLAFMAASSPRDSWLVVPRLNMEALPPAERAAAEQQCEMAGIHLLSIQHLNELNSHWCTNLAPAVKISTSAPSTRMRVVVPTLILLAISVVGFWSWHQYIEPNASSYRLTGGSADRLWCASATLPEYLSTWQLSDQQPPCMPQGNENGLVLVELLVQAQSESGFAVDHQLYTRFHALDSVWLEKLKQQSPIPALELLHALETRLGRVEQVRQQTVQLHQLAQQVKRNNRYRDAEQFLRALSALDADVRSWLNASEVDLPALEAEARQRMRQVEIQRVAVEYYWEKLQSGDLDVTSRFQAAATALGQANWELLPQEIRQEIEKY